MNHSYHEMIIGHGRALSCIVFSEKSRIYQVARADPMYHRAQILGTLAALERRGRFAVAISLRDTDEETLQALEEFFTTAAASGKRKTNG